MSEAWKRAIIVVPAADRDGANADADFAVPGCGPPFDVPLVAATDPAGAVTHYWCSWQVTAIEYDLLETLFDGQSGRRMYDGHAVAARDVLEALGLVTVSVEDEDPS